mmetsp:Transcript_64913/g.182705  ORF Transcript_64913/g.182705 Transcript_64913/m.182705 type:complete len:255 (-) Transcript_64913:486-1250(-)
MGFILVDPHIGASVGASGPSLKTTSRASWSLPPVPRFAVHTTPAPGTLLKMLSTPPHMVPLNVRRRPPSSCSARTVEESAFALKSPTRKTASRASACSATILSRWCAVAAPPHRPPVLRGSGPWWFTKKAVLPVALCTSRIHCAKRFPKYSACWSSATAASPPASMSQDASLKAMHSAAGPWNVEYRLASPATSSTMRTFSHSWKPITSYFSSRATLAMRSSALSPFPCRISKRFHQKRLNVITFTSTGAPTKL